MEILNKDYETASIDAIKPHPDNPNKGDAAAISESIDTNGFYGAVVAQRSSGHILAGNHRWIAAKMSGAHEIPVVWVECDDDEALRILVADNRHAEFGKRSPSELAGLLEYLSTTDVGLAGTGYDDDQLNELLSKLSGVKASEETEIPEEHERLLEKWETEVGQKWRIGSHCLVVGDCTDPEIIDLLFFPAFEACCIICDPPYGVAYVGKTKDAMTIENDEGLDYEKFFGDFLALAPLEEKNTAYIFMSGQELHRLRIAFESAGFTWGDYLIWVKDRFVLGRKDYNAQHEFILYGWKGAHKFYGPNNASTIIQHDRPTKNDLHPTMKPIDLVARLVNDGSRIGGVVYDPFLGSGTTMIAAHSNDRVCYGCELDPAYAAVILERMERMGLTPELDDAA